MSCSWIIKVFSRKNRSSLERWDFAIKKATKFYSKEKSESLKKSSTRTKLLSKSEIIEREKSERQVCEDYWTKVRRTSSRKFWMRKIIPKHQKRNARRKLKKEKSERNHSKSVSRKGHHEDLGEFENRSRSLANIIHIGKCHWVCE